MQLRITGQWCRRARRHQGMLSAWPNEVTGAYTRQLTRTKAVIEEGCQVAEALPQQGGVGGKRVKANQQLPPQLLGPAAAHYICSHKASSRCCIAGGGGGGDFETQRCNSWKQ